METPKAQKILPDISECFNHGWELYKREPLLLSGATLIAGILNAVASSIPFANVLVYGHLLAGLYMMLIALEGDKKPGIANLFDGYQYFLPILIATVLMSIFTTIGFLLLVIPGVYVAIVYGFSTLNIVTRSMDFWPAMESSRKTIHAVFWHYAVFAFLILLIIAASAIPFGLGLLVSVPVCLAAHIRFYQQCDVIT